MERDSRDHTTRSSPIVFKLPIMIHLNFTIKEMTDALERVGYTVKLEKVTDTRFGRQYDLDGEELFRDTYMVYYGNQCITSGAKFENMFDVSRLEEIFTIELKKRLVGW